MPQANLSPAQLWPHSTDLLDFPQGLNWIEFEDAGEVEQFDHINPPLTALKTRDKGLVLAHGIRNLLLREPGILTALNDIGDKGHVPCFADEFHEPVSVLPTETLMIYFSDYL